MTILYGDVLPGDMFLTRKGQYVVVSVTIVPADQVEIVLWTFKQREVRKLLRFVGSPVTSTFVSGARR